MASGRLWTGVSTTVLFRLRSANGTEVTPRLQLAPGTTYGSRMYLMENAVEHEAQLWGTAEYVGQPETAVRVDTWDNAASYQHTSLPILYGEYWQYNVIAPIGGKKKTSFLWLRKIKNWQPRPR